MTRQLIIIPANARRPVRKYRATACPSLGRIQRIVGGTAERVPRFDNWGLQPCVVYCNEDGKRLDLPDNLRASVLWCVTLGHQLDDMLVGNVVIVVNLH